MWRRFTIPFLCIVGGCMYQRARNRKINPFSRYAAVSRCNFTPFLSPLFKFMNPDDVEHLLIHLERLLCIGSEEDAQRRSIQGRFCMYEFKRIVYEYVADADDDIAISAFMYGRKNLPAVLELIHHFRKQTARIS